MTPWAPVRGFPCTAEMETRPCLQARKPIGLWEPPGSWRRLHPGHSNAGASRTSACCKNEDVVDTRSVVACTECQMHWNLDLEVAKCTDPDHTHQRFEVHLHRSVVVLPDGTEVTAVSFDVTEPYAREQPPDYGLYLDHKWQPPWSHDHLDWPDFGVPDDATHVVTALTSVLERARAGERVEVGCMGGHGRTGTALACLAILTGHPHGEAVAWVRANYCSNAVETPEQEAFVVELVG
jgi:Protein-tyrosine phosphatase